MLYQGTRVKDVNVNLPTSTTIEKVPVRPLIRRVGLWPGEITKLGNVEPDTLIKGVLIIDRRVGIISAVVTAIVLYASNLSYLLAVFRSTLPVALTPLILATSSD